jgi:hypothetical protein
MLKLVVAAHNCRVFRPNNVLNALHELAEDFESGLWRQDEWSCPVMSIGSNGLTIGHWADAFDWWYGLVELHDDHSRLFEEMKDFRIAKGRMLAASLAWDLNPP